MADMGFRIFGDCKWKVSLLHGNFSRRKIAHKADNF
jgi:hypothetical protein